MLEIVLISNMMSFKHALYNVFKKKADSYAALVNTNYDMKKKEIGLLTNPSNDLSN